MRIVISTGGIVGLAERIIEKTFLILSLFLGSHLSPYAQRCEEFRRRKIPPQNICSKYCLNFLKALKTFKKEQTVEFA